MNRTAVVGCLSAALLVTGCGGSSEATPQADLDASSAETGQEHDAAPLDAAPVPSELCVQVAALRCSWFDRCWSLSLAGAFGDKAACEQFHAQLCMVEGDLPGRIETPAQRLACAQYLSDSSCGDALLSLTHPTANPSPCVSHGSLPQGQRCKSNDQCESGSCAVSQSGCRECRTLPGEGESCTDRCGGDLRCGSDHVCAKSGWIGDSCASSQDCLSYLDCKSAHCAAPAMGAAGAACDLGPNLDCNVMNGLSCEAGSCAPTQEPLDAGQACAEYTDTCRGGYCKEGSCTPHLAEGAACDNANGGACDPLWCVDGACGWPAPDACY